MVRTRRQLATHPGLRTNYLVWMTGYVAVNMFFTQDTTNARLFLFTMAASYVTSIELRYWLDRWQARRTQRRERQP